MGTSLDQVRVNHVAKYFMGQVAKYVENLAEVIGKGEAARLTTNLVIKANDALEKSGKGWTWDNVDAAKFMMDAVRMVTLGLDAGNNECYPIPYENRKTGKVELQCSPSAKGHKKLVIQYAAGKEIVDFICFSIKEGDKFTIKHVPGNDIWSYEEDIFGSGKVKGWVTIAIYDDGTSQVMTHTKEDIEKRRKASKSPDSPAWKNWYDEMAQAKAIRRHTTRIAIQMPAVAEKALKELEGEQTEQEMKDVTPETIALPEFDKPIPEQREPEADPTPVEPMPQEEADYMDQLPIDESWMRG